MRLKYKAITPAWNVEGGLYGKNNNQFPPGVVRVEPLVTFKIQGRKNVKDLHISE